MNSKNILFLSLGMFCADVIAVNLTVDAQAGHRDISPSLYGVNNLIGNDGLAKSNAYAFQQAGVKLIRQNNGNNATKYNWKKKLSSHPDWYNNVYASDWDQVAKTLETSFPGVQGMFGFQLLGWAANNTANNFNDWAYNQSKSWGKDGAGVHQNLAGGGVINSAGTGQALTDGDPLKYLQTWPADSTVGILNHWFGSGGLGLKKQNLVYWNMDNEPEIWNGTHDDVLKGYMNPEDYIQKYVAVALKARAAYPDIKLVGPVFTNDWQWFTWQDWDQYKSFKYQGRFHSWMEYFIRRIGEEQQKHGVRLLDVLDFHFYPQLDGSDPAQVETLANIHRLWFDTTWNYPKSNGLKTIHGGWDHSQTKYYIWKRNMDWMNQWLGPNHGVTFGLSESGATANMTAQQMAHWYASHLGVFADNGVELFAPWEWYPGQLEVLHLFGKYAKNVRVASQSSADTLVSAYSSLNKNGDSLTVILVNHSTKTQQIANVTLQNFAVASTTAETRSLANLSGETFVDSTQNALAKGQVNVNQNALSVTLPPLGITAVVLKGSQITSIGTPVTSQALYWKLDGEDLSVAAGSRHGTLRLMNVQGEIVLTAPYLGQELSLSTRHLAPGVYSGSLDQKRFKFVVK